VCQGVIVCQGLLEHCILYINLVGNYVKGVGHGGNQTAAFLIQHWTWSLNHYTTCPWHRTGLTSTNLPKGISEILSIENSWGESSILNIYFSGSLYIHNNRFKVVLYAAFYSKYLQLFSIIDGILRKKKKFEVLCCQAVLKVWQMSPSLCLWSVKLSSHTQQWCGC